jgi:hypothetical protein
MKILKTKTYYLEGQENEVFAKLVLYCKHRITHHEKTGLHKVLGATEQDLVIKMADEIKQ